MNVAGNWAGRIYGTNTGNLFIKINQIENHLTGTLKVLDNVAGAVVYEVSGEANDNVQITLVPIQSQPGVMVGNVEVKATLNEQGQLVGEWQSEIGTGGVFHAFPHGDIETMNTQIDGEPVPEQIFNRTTQIGSVRLFGEDLERLLNVIKKDFIQGRLVVSYDYGGNRVVRYAEDFLKDAKEIGALKSLSINIQEPEDHGINRAVALELSETFGSEIRVSGANETWVTGKAENIQKAVKKYQRHIVTNYRKHGLDFNFLVFLAMIITVPEIENWVQRLLFVGCVFGLLSVLLIIHRKFIPNTVVNVNHVQKGWAEYVPSIVSWLLTIAGAIIAGFILQLLVGNGTIPSR